MLVTGREASLVLRASPSSTVTVLANQETALGFCFVICKMRELDEISF